MKLADLINDYKDDKDTADAKYKGKRLRVSGFVGSKNPRGNDGAYVHIYAKSRRNSAMLIFGSQYRDQALALKKAKNITVVCTGDGKISGPLLRDCVFP